jgi:putative transcriptional regulator
MMLKNIEKGRLLIAEPTILGDLTFNRAVILIADHSKNGTVGFILNKPLQYSIADLIPNIYSDFVVHNGGPVEQDNLYFIHNVPHLIPNSIEIADGIYWGGNFDLTRKLINEKKINEQNILFFLGYTGWESRQLENEIETKSWILIQNTNENQIIQKSKGDFWKEKMKALGGKYQLWSNAPENPNLN